MITIYDVKIISVMMIIFRCSMSDRAISDVLASVLGEKYFYVHDILGIKTIIEMETQQDFSIFQVGQPNLILFMEV